MLTGSKGQGRRHGPGPVHRNKRQGLQVLHTHVSQPMLWIQSLTPYLTTPGLTLAWLCPRVLSPSLSFPTLLNSVHGSPGFLM